MKVDESALIGSPTLVLQIIVLESLPYTLAQELLVEFYTMST